MTLTTLETPDGDSGVDEIVLDRLYHAAAHARQQAQAVLSKPAFTQLILGLGRNLLSLPADDQQRQAKSWAQAVLDTRWQRLLERGQNFAKLSDAGRHETRIAAKKLRYAIDIFAPVYPPKHTDRFISTLSALQDELGTTNDRVIARQLLQKLPKRTASISFALGQISGVLQCQAKQTARVSHAIWEELLASKLFWR